MSGTRIKRGVYVKAPEHHLTKKEYEDFTKPAAKEIDKTKAVLPESKSDWIAAPTKDQLMGGR